VCRSMAGFLPTSGEIEIGAQKYCLKRALAQLKVSQLWEAPIERNDAEWKWARRAEAIWPGSAPRLVAQDRNAASSSWEYLDPDRYPNWKSQLRDGILREETAAAVAERLVAHPRADGRPARGRCRVRYRRLFLRYPARASIWSPPGASILI